MTQRTPEEGQQEVNLCRQVFDLATAGAEVPPELLDRWREARGRYVARLRGLDSDRAEDFLLREIQAVERAVEDLEEGGGGGGDPEPQVRRALELGERMRWYLWILDALSGEAAGDPLSFVAEELGWLKRSSRELESWDESLAPASAEILRKVDRARSLLARRKFLRFVQEEEETGGGSPLDQAAVCWLRASESYQIELEFLTLRTRAGVHEAFTGDLRKLRELREGHLKACAEALRAADPVEVGQFLHREATDIADYSSAVLSETATGGLEERIPALKLLAERTSALLRVLGDRRKALCRKGILTREDRVRAGKDLRVLRKTQRRTRTARQEAEAALRLERFFGVRRVRFFETLLFFMIFAFLGIIFVEWRLPEGSPHRFTLHMVDLVFCVFFQIDFFLRWGFARWSGRYFLRHFFFESLPALPYGLIFHVLAPARDLRQLEEARYVFVVRLIRLRPVLLLAIRIFRVLFFFIRGADRAVERFRPLLDRDVVLFEPDPLGEGFELPVRNRLLALEDRRQRLVRNLYADVSWARRPGLLSGYLSLLDAESRLALTMDLPHVRRAVELPGEIHLERVIHRCLDCDSAGASAYLGYDGTRRVARWLRFLDVPLLRDLPLVRSLVPAARTRNPPEAVATAIQAVGRMLQNMLSGFRFWGDLAGITTGAQVLDRLASTIIAATKRPAVRLLMFGSLFVILKGLVLLSVEVFGLHLDVLKVTFTAIARILGLPLLILGSVCMILLLVSRWLKRIAGEALDVYLRTSEAHFYSLLKLWKLRRRSSDLRFLYRSVFVPELKLRQAPETSEEDWLRFLDEPSEAPPRGGVDDPRFSAYSGDRELVTLLYRDFLDGPILHRLDDKTSVQLLGNLVVQETRIQTLGMSRRELRKLEWLDLAKDRILTLGPYFWFRFITESLAIETAKLVMEYNACCIPKSQMELASREARQRFDDFLVLRRGQRDRAAEQRSARALRGVGEPLQTTQFTALDFLTVDPDRDSGIQRRFGDGVLEAVRKDRRSLVREVFGTRPYHLLPRTERIFNPYRLYRRYLSGLRIFFLPVLLIARSLYLALRQIWRLVDEVLGRRRSVETRLPRAAGFDVAVRKLNRMRKPFFMEALKLRASIDVEYLGLRLPGVERGATGPTYEEDLAFIGALEAERQPVDTIRASALRDLRRFRNFLAERGWLSDGLEGLLEQLDPSGGLSEHRLKAIRALVTAFVTDHESLRSRLTAPEAFRSIVESVLERKVTLLTRLWGGISATMLRFLPARRRRIEMLNCYLASVDDYRQLTPKLRRRLTRAILRAPPETERTLTLVVEPLREAGAGEGGVLQALQRAAMDHPSWTRKIITARTIQAITVLDVQSYRDLVYEAGGYEEG